MPIITNKKNKEFNTIIISIFLKCKTDMRERSVTFIPLYWTLSQTLFWERSQFRKSD